MKANSKSELWEYLEELRIKATTNKDDRIQFKQIGFYIQLLENNGTHLPDNVTKHIDEDIWEQLATTIFPERRLKSHENLERL